MKKIISKIGIILLVVVLLVYVAFPISVGLFATFKFNKDVGNPPVGFKNINLKTSDDITLSSWYAESKNGSVIILVHGSTSSRESIRKHAKMLIDNGYGVLAFDMRGHGESNGDGATAYNWDGTKDVRAAVDYLLAQDDVKSIGALGLSLGAEVLLGAVSDNKEIKAIVSEGASYRSTGDYVALPKNNNFMRSYVTRLMYLSVGFFSNSKEPTRIVDSIKNAKDTKFFFIAAGNIENERDYNTYYNSLIKDRSKLWIIKDCNHTAGITKEKDNYYKNVINFLNENLIENN